MQAYAGAAQSPQSDTMLRLLRHSEEAHAATVRRVQNPEESA